MEIIFEALENGMETADSGRQTADAGGAVGANNHLPLQQSPSSFA